MQIRTRLTLQFILIVVIILQLSLFFIYFKFKDHVEDQFYNDLKSKAYMTAEMLVNIQNVEPTEQTASDKTEYYLESKENFLIFNHENKKIYEFNKLKENEIPVQTLEQVKNSGEYRFTHGKFNSIGIFYTNKFDKEYTVISEAVFNSTDLANLRNIIIIDFCLIILILTVSGWLFAGNALRPVTNIMNQLDKILPSDLSQRLQTTGNKDELWRLGDTFNKLLDRIETAFKHQKSFLSNISHELKNPLTVITSQLEVVLTKERSNEDYRKTLSSVLEDVRDLSVVSDQLMQLARIKNNINQVEFETIRLDEVIWEARSAIIRSFPHYKINVVYNQLPDETEHLEIQGNEQLLKTALQNIMDNGCKFSEDNQVKVEISGSGNVWVKISDHGPGISDAEKKLVLSAFYRSPENSMIKGSGVGLALVDSILNIHHARLIISDNEPKGTVFTILFDEGLIAANG